MFNTHTVFGLESIFLLIIFCVVNMLWLKYQIIMSKVQ